MFAVASTLTLAERQGRAVSCKAAVCVQQYCENGSAIHRPVRMNCPDYNCEYNFYRTP